MPAQTASISPSFGEGLTLQSGIGFLAVRDEFISQEKYTGSLPVYSISWSLFNDSYGLRLYLNYGHASNLKNYNVTSDIKQSLLGISFLYPTGSISVFSKDMHFFLGPAAEMFTHNQIQNISNFGAYDASASAALYSVCLRTEAYYNIMYDLKMHASAQMSILSIAKKTTANLYSGTGTENVILTPLAGFNSHLEINVLYRIAGSLYASAGYRFELAEISEWDYFISAEDQFTASISYDF